MVIPIIYTFCEFNIMLKGGLQDGRRVYCAALYANVQLSAIILLYTNWPNTKAYCCSL